MVDVGKMSSGIVLMIVGVFIVYTVINSLFGTTNTSVETLCTTATASGYTTEGSLFKTAWKILLVGLALAPFGMALIFIKEALHG